MLLNHGIVHPRHTRYTHTSLSLCAHTYTDKDACVCSGSAGAVELWGTNKILKTELLDSSSTVENEFIIQVEVAIVYRSHLSDL